MKALRVILGDQLSRSISSLDDANKDTDIILLCEVHEEATYVKHHKKKIALLFSAMRHFASSLEHEGFCVRYTRLDDEDNTGSFIGEVKRTVEQESCDSVIVTEPGEYRVLKSMQQWQNVCGVPVGIRKDTRFFCDSDTFNHWAEGRKELRMEFFYRQMRKQHSILMEGDDPAGGSWNFDKKNRKSLPDSMTIAEPKTFSPDSITQEVLTLVEERFADHFGTLEPFEFAVTRDQALEVLECFIVERLPHFGDYQDAMKQGEPWLFHSHISFYLNCGLLLPREVVERAEEAFDNGDALINAVEGFIRQILGWREYVRGIYWRNMPSYAHENHLQAKRALPAFFWDADTRMNCLHQCIKETQANAYAHHIQRLMVLGNFMLLAGIDPGEVNEWYLIVYADAYEWVEMPNVSGMILYADGGVLASKPYAASGSYINKMSDYCKHCSYKVTVKEGESACPFNYLYWDFLIRNKESLADNPRLRMPYATLKNMSAEKTHTIQKDTKRFLDSLP